MTTLLLNNELNGVELYFDSKPQQETINTMKSLFFRWNPKKYCWYAKQNDKTLSLANELVNGNTNIEINQEVKIESKHIDKVTAKNISLWELTRIEEKAEVNKKLSVKEITSEIRNHIKTRFPMCKFSVTTDNSSIRLKIMSSPFDKDSIYLKAIKDYCTQYASNYNYCTHYDPYGDYGSSYHFYDGRCEIYYKYEQCEQTEQIKTNMLDFDNQLKAFEKAEEERKEKEYQEREIERQKEHEQYLIRVEEEKKQIEIINSSVTVNELNTNEQYFVIGSQFAKLNKNCTLDQYKEEVANGEENYSLETVKINKEIHFSTIESLDYFSNMLLHDFDFLTGTGGSYTDDNRINSMTDYYNMTSEEKESIKWNLEGVAVYYNNQLQFIIDAQGFSYARYVGLVDNVTVTKEYTYNQVLTNEQITELKEKAEILEDYSIEVITELNLLKTWNNENWQQYKEALKAKLKANQFKLTKSIIQQLTEDSEQLKVAMYKLLVEVDGIQEQFKNADLQQGQKVTMFYINDFGGMTTSKVTIESVENTKYAQYDNAVKITFKPQGKRSLYYKHHYSDMLLYNDWLELPETVLHEVKQSNGFMITSTKYLSCDKQQYDEIINYFSNQGIMPLVNTYKPII